MKSPVAGQGLPGDADISYGAYTVLAHDAVAALVPTEWAGVSSVDSFALDGYSDRAPFNGSL